MMKVDDFLKMVRKAVELPSLYVMGGWGFPLNASNKERTQKNEYNRREARKKKIFAAADNVFGWDCVGLTKGILWGWTGDASKRNGGASYAANGVPDYDAKGMMFNGCSDPSKDFSTIEPGEFLWLDGHCGVYLGDGLAAESTPNWKDGAQITCVSNLGTKAGYNKRKWTYHGHLKYVDYSGVKPEPQKYPDPPFKVTCLKSGITGRRADRWSSSKYLGTLDKGTYTIVSVSGDFGQLKEVQGWIYLVDDNLVIERSLDGYTVGKKYKVVPSDGLNLRTEPSTKADVIKLMPKGAIVLCRGLKMIDGNTWMQIVDCEGWCAAHYNGDRYVK